jgi:hypothetical protein
MKKVHMLKILAFLLVIVCISCTWLLLKTSARLQETKDQVSAKDIHIAEQRDILEQIVKRSITMDALDCDCLDKKIQLLLGTFSLPKESTASEETIKKFLLQQFGSGETTVFRGNFDSNAPTQEYIITISNNPGGYGMFLILFSQNTQGEWIGHWEDIPWSQKEFQADLIPAKNGLPAFLSLRYGGNSMFNGSLDQSIYTITYNKLNTVFERNIEDWNNGYPDENPTFARFAVSFDDVDKDGINELIWEGSEYVCKKEPSPVYDCEKKDRLTETSSREVYHWKYDHFVVDGNSKK